MRVLLSRLYPLEAGWDGEGVDFALLSEIATAAGLCSFGQSDQTKESPRIRNKKRINEVGHASSQRSSWAHRQISVTAPMTPLGSTRQSVKPVIRA